MRSLAELFRFYISWGNAFHDNSEERSDIYFIN